MKFSAILHHDVKGTPTKYLVLEINTGKKHFISIGQKTYDEVKAMEEEENKTAATTAPKTNGK